jgi:hypothetical protein
MTVVHTVPAALAGPAVREALQPGQRDEFDQDFRAALASVARTFDIDELAEVVRRWWLIVGGDPEVVETDRERAFKMARLSGHDWPEPRPLYVPHAVVDQTGPAVRAALTGDDQARFEAEFGHALDRAATTLDHRPVAEVVARWWAVAVVLANPEDLAQDLATARELAALEVQQ